MFNLVKISGTSGTEQRILNNYKYLRLVLPGTVAGTVLAQTLVTGTNWLRINHSAPSRGLRVGIFHCIF